MTDKNGTALQKMQQIANRLISNTPELAKILDQDSALRPKRSTSPNSKKKNIAQTSLGVSQLHAGLSRTQLTPNDYQERAKDLMHEVQTWKEKANSMQQQIVVIKQRFVEREIQYRKIIEELQDQIKCKSALDTSDKNRMQNINELHSQILKNIETIQDKTSQILTQQQSDIRRFFHKKINQIKQKFKEDKINKTEKDQQYQQKQKQMMSQLQWIKNIAHKIDLQNQNVMKKYSSLKSEFDIQEKDKDILLKQLLMKKKENAVLKSQVEQYQKLLNEVSREMQQTDSAILVNNSDFLQNSRTKGQNGSSRIKNQTKFKEVDLKDSRNDTANDKRYDTTINHLKNVIQKQRKRVRDLKNLYMRQMTNKSELQLIIRKLVEDVRQSIIQLQKDKPRRRKNEDEFDVNAREQLLERILANQKILTLIYDKTFYAVQKPYSGDQQMPKQLSRIMQNQEDQGFH